MLITPLFILIENSAIWERERKRGFKPLLCSLINIPLLKIPSLASTLSYGTRSNKKKLTYFTRCLITKYPNLNITILKGNSNFVPLNQTVISLSCRGFYLIFKFKIIIILLLMQFNCFSVRPGAA